MPANVTANPPLPHPDFCLSSGSVIEKKEQSKQVHQALVDRAALAVVVFGD